MREILFRGKRLNDGSWVYGYYVHQHGSNLIYTDKEHAEYEFDNIHVDPATVGQYTGLTDRNGNRVFEWDILKIYKRMDGIGAYHFPSVEYPALVIVKWDFCAWQWEVQGRETYYIHFPDAWCHYECEVVGNIHDNQALLEEEA